MKKNIQTTLIALLALLPLGMQAQSVVTKELYEGTQILNSDFEDFHKVTGNSKDYIEPNYWHSFATAQGTLVQYTGQDLESVADCRPNSKGDSCVAIRAASLKVLFFTVVANATLTTGRMNAGNASPSSTDNHAFTEVSNVTDEDGFPFYSSLTARPDSISVWLKFTPKSGTPKASISAVVTNGQRYQEPVDKDYADVIVAKASNTEIEATNGWKRFVLPFDTDGCRGGDPQAIMVTLSTNANPGQGTAGDELLIDDLELIYTQEVVIPDCGYYAFTNIAQKNHAVVMPEGLVGYALGLTANGKPIVTKTYKAGDVIPYETSLLLEGKADKYYFKTTLYETGDSLELNDDGKLVDGTELNDPIEGYQYYHLVSDVDGNPEFIVAEKGLKVMPGKALLRVKADLAAESYNHVLTESSVEGDVDGNGKVEATDVKALVDRLLGNELGMKGFLIPDADVNGDKTVDVADVTQLINILLHE